MRLYLRNHKWVGLFVVLALSTLMSACSLLRTAPAVPQPELTPRPYTGDEPHTEGLWHFDESDPLAEADGRIAELKTPGHNTHEGEWQVVPGMFGTGVRLVGYKSLAFDIGGRLSNTFTAEAWIKLDSDAFQAGHFGLFHSRWPTDIFEVNFNSDKRIRFTLRDTNGATVVLEGDVSFMQSETWYHVAVVVEARDDEPNKPYVKLYVTPAGEIEANLVKEGGLDLEWRSIEGNFFYIGNSNASQQDRYFRGVIDEVRVSNAALGPEDFTTLGF